MKVIGFGDSILKGAVLTDGPTLKYSLLQAGFLEQVCSGKGLELANHARFGSTITTGRSIFDRFFHTVGEGDVVVFEFGGNDCDFPWAKIGADADYPKEPFTPMDGFLSEYAEMIRLCRERGARPVMMSLPPRCGQVLPPRNAGVGSCGQGERSQMDERKDGFHQ